MSERTTTMMRAYFFGAWAPKEIGHFLYGPGGRSVYRDERATLPDPFRAPDDSRPTEAFAFPGDRQPHPHNLED